MTIKQYVNDYHNRTQKKRALQYRALKQKWFPTKKHTTQPGTFLNRHGKAAYDKLFQETDNTFIKMLKNTPVKHNHFSDQANIDKQLNQLSAVPKGPPGFNSNPVAVHNQLTQLAPVPTHTIKIPNETDKLNEAFGETQAIPEWQHNKLDLLSHEFDNVDANANYTYTAPAAGGRRRTRRRDRRRDRRRA